jgi:ATP-dependent protease HslVU (ClpYQ) peptidase subunit
MTCIVGLVDGHTAWIGGDSAGVAGWDLSVRADEKVFRNGPMIFGFTSSFRMGQVLRYALTIPDHDPRHSVEQYMVTTFIDDVRTCLKTAGYATKDKEQEEGGCFLVAYRGKIFKIGEDYQVGIPADGFTAVGCGSQFARGALFATARIMDAKARVDIALQAAERCCAGVRGPFTVLSIEMPQVTS